MTMLHEAGVESVSPLSPLQEGLLFHALLEATEGVYVVQELFELHGPLDVAIFKAAWQAVVDRHSVLRTAFSWQRTDRPVQVVLAHVALPVREEDWSALSETDQRLRLDALLEADRRQGFDLTQAPLTRIALCRLGHDRLRVVWTSHHALLDGWSSELLLRDLVHLYRGIASGEPAQLPEPVPYAAYIGWLRQQEPAPDERFWRERLRGFVTPVPLVLPPPDGGGPLPERAVEETRLSEAASGRLQSLATGCRVTLGTVVNAAWALLLAAYSGRDDVLFGVVVSGRPPELPGVDQMVGLFINTLPIRVRLAPQLVLGGWLRELQGQLAATREHQYRSLVEINGWSEVPRGTDLFESSIAFENFPMAGELHESVTVVDPRVVHRTTIPLNMTVVPEREMRFWIEYDGHRFDAAAVRRLLQHLSRLLEEMCESPERRLDQLGLMDAPTRSRLVDAFNAPAPAAPGTDLVHDLVHGHACRAPASVAIASAATRITFAELDERVGRLARRLRRLGVGPEVPVGLYLERSPDLVTAVLAVLTAGGAYVPLDPEQPAERLAFMLRDSGAAVVLTQPELEPGLPETAAVVVRVDGDGEREAPDAGAPATATGSNLAYIVYTSGSTGRPKGVGIEHRALANYVGWASGAYDVAAGRGAPVHTPLAFDLTVTSLLVPLAAGLPVVLVPADQGLDGLANLLREEGGFSLLKLTPAHLGLLRQLLGPEAAAGRAGQFVIGGEELPAEELAWWRRHAPDTVLVNEYGPTETTVGCCIHRAAGEPGASVPIGRPAASARLYVCDRWMRPQPIGVVGELCIGGPGVGRGYAGRPDLTAERFVPDPFAARRGARMYRSGDLARHRADGELDFLGRADHQVQVRGHRVEPGEVEAALAAHPVVAQVVVVGRQEAGENRLVAYLVAGDAERPDGTELRRHVLERLPEHMAPSAYVWLEHLPLNANGKVDRRRLPAPDRRRPQLEKGYRAPSTPAEQLIADVWADVLRLERVGVDDDFFELDGHSLLAVRLSVKIGLAFEIELPVRSIYEARTVASLAALVASIAGAAGDEPSGWSPAAQLQGQGDRPPLFLVHPINGQVLCYLPLAGHLWPDQPLYGLQASEDVASVPEETIEQMALAYITAMRAVQPRGPYRIGGWSMGGVIAFEMAQQLHQQGEEVALLAIIDTPLPRGVPDTDDDEDDFAAVLHLFPAEMTKDLRGRMVLLRGSRQDGSPEARLEFVLEELRAAGLLPDGASPAWLRRIQVGYAARMQALRVYQPRPYQGTITYFRAVEHVNTSGGEMTDYHRQLLEDPAFGWGSYAVRPIELLVVPGHHDSLVAEPNVTVLARELRARLDRTAGLR